MRDKENDWANKEAEESRAEREREIEGDYEMVLTWRLFTPAEIEGNSEEDDPVVGHTEETAVAIMQKL
jgi:hypothetical protein